MLLDWYLKLFFKSFLPSRHISLSWDVFINIRGGLTHPPSPSSELSNRKAYEGSPWMFVNTSTVQHWLSPNLQTMIEMCETCRKKPGTTMPDEEEEEGEKRETIGIQPGGGDASPRQALEILAILPTQIEFHTSQLHPPPPPPVSHGTFPKYYS